jgi:hypothetical protein
MSAITRLPCVSQLNVLDCIVVHHDQMSGRQRMRHLRLSLPSLLHMVNYRQINLPGFKRMNM